MRYFDENILKIIDMLEYKMYLIKLDKHIDCVCKNFDTKQGNKFCPRCLGTGYKIKIKEIKAVRQPLDISTANMGVRSEVGVYFMKYDYKIAEDDLLIWGNEIEKVVKTDRFCSDSEKPVYFRCETTPKKYNNKLFLKMFFYVFDKVVKPNE